jgi:diguanylate cyclase (GGDEF)-like protein
MDSGPESPKSRVSERWLDVAIARAAQLSRAQAWAITVLAIVLTGFIEWAKDPDIWFGPFYLLIVCLPAWTIGWRAALGVGFVCAGVSLLANGMSAYPLGQVAVVWNMAMRVLALAFIVMLVAGFRRSYDREWRRARNDELTGVLNKEAFFERTAMRRESGEWGILAYVDLDGFKPINDRHGHAAGDTILRAFAGAMRSHIRARDVFARIGGDEFLLFLPTESEIEGHNVAARLHERANHILEHMAHPVSCSMGVVVLDPAGGGLSAADVELADRLMYEAKRLRSGLRIVTRGLETIDDATPSFLARAAIRAAREQVSVTG